LSLWLSIANISKFAMKDMDVNGNGKRNLFLDITNKKKGVVL
jgi:hypothetical protein